MGLKIKSKIIDGDMLASLPEDYRYSQENDGKLEHRILKVLDWIPHLEKLGVGAVLFNPVFESDTHGYNTRDYRKIDTRLGTNEDFKKICRYKCQVPLRVNHNR